MRIDGSRKGFFLSTIAPNDEPVAREPLVSLGQVRRRASQDTRTSSRSLPSLDLPPKLRVSGSASTERPGSVRHAVEDVGSLERPMGHPVELLPRRIRHCALEPPHNVYGPLPPIWSSVSGRPVVGLLHEPRAYRGIAHSLAHLQPALALQALNWSRQSRSISRMISSSPGSGMIRSGRRRSEALQTSNPCAQVAHGEGPLLLRACSRVRVLSRTTRSPSNTGSAARGTPRVRAAPSTSTCIRSPQARRARRAPPGSPCPCSQYAGFGCRSAIRSAARQALRALPLADLSGGAVGAPPADGLGGGRSSAYAAPPRIRGARALPAPSARFGPPTRRLRGLTKIPKNRGGCHLTFGRRVRIFLLWEARRWRSDSGSRPRSST